MYQAQVGEKIICDVKRLGINGEGIAFYQKQTIFIPEGIPGEIVEIEIVEDKKKYAIGRIIRIVKASEDRIIPDCKFYKECGGCSLKHIKYERTLQLKREIVIEALTRYSGLNPKLFEIKPTIGMENIYGYRNKSSLPVNYDGKHTVVGIYKMGENKMTYIDSCNVQNKYLNEINQKICALIDKNTLTAYNPRTKQGHVRYIVTRVAFSTLEIQVTIVLNQKTSKIEGLLDDISKLEHVKSVYTDYNPDPKSVEIFGDELKLERGEKKIVEKLGKFEFSLFPDSFFQLNPVQAKVLYDTAKKACKLSKRETVLDAYCGVGTIGLWVSDLAKTVIGIDSNKEAIRNARENVEKNNIRNAKFYVGDTKEVLQKLSKDGVTIDVMVFDPPRTGLEGSKDIILSMKPKRVVYVSCNPATMAKDLSYLKENYQVKYVQPVDMFPGTAHVESIVLLSLKGQK